MEDRLERTNCCGCGASLAKIEGPIHAYMTSTPACYALFCQVLACEYSDANLLPTHRLTVDTYAVQHPGQDASRQQIQSVGLHLARLGLQLASPISPTATNDVMLGLGKHKHTLIYLDPPESFAITVADVADFAGTPDHPSKVKEWAAATWNDWSRHHDYIQCWTTKWL